MRHRGPITPRRLSEDALAALASGDVAALIEANRREFGGFVMMADPPDDDDDGDDDDDDDDSSSDDAGSDGSDDGDDGDSQAELERLRKRMQAADKRATAAEKALKKKEDAEKGDLERAQSALTDLEKQNKELSATVSELRLQNAFLTANKITWHDPDTALALAQSKGFLADVVDEESGEVDKKALAKSLERLSKEHEYLVKTSKDDKQEDAPPSGEPSGGRSDNKKDDKAKKAAMKQRFPVLNR